MASVSYRHVYKRWGDVVGVKDLNLALGGQLAGPIGLQTTFPAQLQVDYVRVFQAANP